MKIVLAIPCFINSALLLGWLGLSVYAIVTEPAMQDVDIFDSYNRTALLILAGAFIVGGMFAVAGVVVLSTNPHRKE